MSGKLDLPRLVIRIHAGLIVQRLHLGGYSGNSGLNFFGLLESPLRLR